MQSIFSPSLKIMKPHTPGNTKSRLDPQQLALDRINQGREFGVAIQPSAQKALTPRSKPLERWKESLKMDKRLDEEVEAADQHSASEEQPGPAELGGFGFIEPTLAGMVFDLLRRPDDKTYQWKIK